MTPEIYAADGLGPAGAAARNVSYEGEHKLAERLQLLPLWGLQGCLGTTSAAGGHNAKALSKPRAARTLSGIR